MKERFLIVVLVGLGAGLGSLGRVQVSVWLGMPSGWPVATFVVNGVGSFLIGLLAALIVSGKGWLAGARWRHFTMSGFCGGLTTFSIFSLETIGLFEAGEMVMGAVYIALSVAVWLTAVLGGFGLGTLLRASAGSRHKTTGF